MDVRRETRAKNSRHARGPHRRRRAPGSGCIRPRPGVRRRHSDARQGRLVLRSGVDGTTRPDGGQRPDVAEHDRLRTHGRSADHGVAADRADQHRTDADGAHDGDDVEQSRGGSTCRMAVSAERSGGGCPAGINSVLGGTVPLESHRAGIRTAPSAYVSAATGYASRAHYFWIGGSYQRPMEDGGDRLGDVKSYSVVYGYRPPALRLDYPKPDLRFFVETVGEVTGRARHGGLTMDDTGGHIVLRGRRRCFCTRRTASHGGALFPVYQRTNGTQPRERFRFGVNFSYFFWLN